MSLLRQIASFTARPARWAGASARMSTGPSPFTDPTAGSASGSGSSSGSSIYSELFVPPEDPGPPRAPEALLPSMASTAAAYSKKKPSYDFQAAKLPRYSLYIQASRTNTIATLTDAKKNPILLLSGGKCKFKGRNRSSFEAGYQCAVGVFKRLEEEIEKMDLEWELYLKGFGQGREAVQKALLGAEGSKVRYRLKAVTDITPLKVGGTRAPKAKRR
ncbi:translational machinery component [Obba rivulosa]|uniref:Translational machinery component n=1 Tax=Obba rivulosa TaxID=1052685 RepID=A0A8E2DU27_9APHY|nr:translational machinery component [Obba rivulosa]